MSEATILPAIIEAEPPIEQRELTPGEIVAYTRKTQEVMKAVMRKDVHFGVVPGTQKPSLWQPGAEKLLKTFGLAPDLVVEDLSTGDERRYRVTARIRLVRTGDYIGVGIGEASSNEEKYKWRRAVCDEEFEDTFEDRRRLKYGKKRNGDVYTVKQVRTEHADIANTILKMAKKRALVDGAKSTCAASDIFEQDLEDLQEIGVLEEEREKGVTKPKAKAATPASPPPPPPAQPSRTQPPPPNEPPPGWYDDEPPADSGNDSTEQDGTLVVPPQVWQEISEKWHDRGVISEKQLNRLFAIAKGNGWSSDSVKAEVEQGLSIHVDEIPWGDPYNAIVEVFETLGPEG